MLIEQNIENPLHGPVKSVVEKLIDEEAEPRSRLKSYSLGDHPFVDECIHVRLPKILQSLDMGHFTPETQKGLNEWVDDVVEKLKTGDLTLDDIAGDDGGPSWDQYGVKDRAGKGYDEVEWWWFENYMYRLLAQKVGFFETKQDPFKSHKQGALDGALKRFKPYKFASGVMRSKDDRKEALSSLILRMLWGNRADLSLSAGEVDTSTLNASAKRLEFLLANDLEAITEFMQSDECNNITVVLDNCGIELVCDLDFAFFVLKNFPKKKVTFLCKVYPVFVSDALIQDVELHIDALKELFPEYYGQFDEFMADGRLTTIDHEFYNSPLKGWEMPQDLKDSYATQDIVLIKGDANYRRLFGDTHLDPTTNFNQFMQYWGDVQVVAIRTCKAPLVIGMTQEKLDEVKAKDPEFNLNGNWGFIQFKHN